MEDNSLVGWIKVVFSHECHFEDWDTDMECPTCPQCNGNYGECPCPGPHQEDEYEYKFVDGVMFAKKKEANELPGA